MIKTFWRLALCATALLISASPSFAQQASLADLQAKLSGKWTTTVEGESRQRALVINAVAQTGEGAYLITGQFYFADEKPGPFKSGEVRTSAGNTTVVFVTGADSVYTGTLQSDGTITGTTKYKNGQEKKFKIAKGDPVVAGAFTEFDGKWTGIAVATNINCVNGTYELMIKDGKISGSVVFNTRQGAAPSVVTGLARPDKTLALALARQVDFGRSTRYTLSLDREQFKGRDQSNACTYDVTLKKS